MKNIINPNDVPLRILSAITENITSLTTFKGALEHTINIVCHQTGWDIGHVYAIDMYGQHELISQPIWYIKDEQKHASFRAATEKIMIFHSGQGLPGEVLKTSKPAWLKNIQDDKDSPRKKLCSDMAVKGAFAFPVLNKDKIVAVLEFFSIEEMDLSERWIKSLNQIGYYIGEILQRKHAEKILLEQKNALDQSSLVCTTDIDGKIISANNNFCVAFDSLKKDLMGELLYIFDEKKTRKQQREQIKITLQDTDVWKGETCITNKDNNAIWLQTTIVPQLNEYGIPYQYTLIGYDITDKKQAEEKIEHLAYFDYLTDLPNRILLKDHIKNRIANFSRNFDSFAILHLDIDNFKRINDTFGHHGGDDIIKKIADRLKACCRESDYISRIQVNEDKYPISHLGGDEFSILLSNNITNENIATIANRILNQMTKPFQVDNREVTITSSIGIAIYPGDGSDVGTLLTNAAAASYHAKKLGKSNYQFYTSSITARSTSKLIIEHQLHHALENNEFELYYQPKFKLANNKIISNEALIRWNNKELGIVPPMEFIPIAEESNLILDIGKWVIKTACEQNKIWQRQGFPQLEIAVNVSARQFTQNLSNIVAQILTEVDMDPNYLEIELTEGMLMENSDNILSKLHKLKNIGVNLAIDDFGTGYSSLQYLSKFPIDVLKIDRSFVNQISQGNGDEAIVKAIISLAHTLDLSVVAEGIETVSQQQILKKFNCDIGQGYLMSKPLPADKITEFMQSQFAQYDEKQSN